MVAQYVSNVGFAIKELGDALLPHPKVKPLNPARIVAAVLEDDGVDHARAHDLEPAGSLAQATTFARAHEAIHVHLDARLREREIAGANADSAIVSEHSPGKGGDGSFEVRHGYIPAHR